MNPDPQRIELARLTLARAVLATAVRAQIDVQAAQIAFHAVFSLGPLMALTMTVLSALPFEQLHDRFAVLVLPYVPELVRPWLVTQLHAVTRSPNVAFVVTSILGLLWTISAATNSITVGLSHVGWKLVARWWQRRLRAALIGLVAALGLVLLAVAASVGPFVLTLLSRATGVPFDRLASVAWLRWPIAGFVFSLAAALFMTFGTAQRPRLLAVSWGGATTGFVSVVVSALLGVYLSHAPQFGAYGAAGAVFAALLWLYLLALGLLAGATVAYVLDIRGPHWRPVVRGATHVYTHTLADVQSVRPVHRGRLLRRGRIARFGVMCRGCVACRRCLSRFDPSATKLDGRCHVALGAQGGQVEPEQGDGARDRR